jgi:hypothetical protein
VNFYFKKNILPRSVFLFLSRDDNYTLDVSSGEVTMSPTSHQTSPCLEAVSLDAQVYPRSHVIPRGAAFLFPLFAFESQDGVSFKTLEQGACRV